MMLQKSPLLTWSEGAESGPPVLLLHDRYENPDDEAPESCLADFRTIRVRSARRQMIGVNTMGYFWFIGPFDTPELTTFGDGLHHLETLLLEHCSLRAGQKAFLIGRGEGGVMALTLAAIWPELVAGAVSIDGPFPRNFARFPVRPRMPIGVPVLILARHTNMTETVSTLLDLGAEVEVSIVTRNPMRAVKRWIQGIRLAPVHSLSETTE